MDSEKLFALAFSAVVLYGFSYLFAWLFSDPGKRKDKGYVAYLALGPFALLFAGTLIAMLLGY